MAPPCRQFIFLLFGEDRLHHIAGLGDMRQVNLRLYGLGSPRGGARWIRRLGGGVPEMGAHAIGFVQFE
jgi:hypothetical protein